MRHSSQRLEPGAIRLRKSADLSSFLLLVMQSFCATKPDTSAEADVRSCEELRAALAEVSASAQLLQVARAAVRVLLDARVVLVGARRVVVS